MNYIQTINQNLKPKKLLHYQVIDLFAGCGGLSLGFEAIGFQTLGYEMENTAAKTYTKNLLGECIAKKLETNIDFKKDNIDIIIGGPPCQPFSVGGHQKGHKDNRNGFPIFLNAIKKTNPKIFLFENVRGMLYANKWYFDKITDDLIALGYIIDYQMLNAVNYGVPQNRERLFVIGHRSQFSFPKPSPKKLTVVDAIGDLMNQVIDETKILTPSMDNYVKKYEIASHCINPRDLSPHKPARTLTCRNIAAPTGDMQRVKLPDGRRRRLVVREAARLQSFPDWFEFCGTETNQFNQIGNAVPPLLAYHLAQSIKNCLDKGQLYDKKEIQNKRNFFKPMPTLF
ncbi:DNA cytosine methyltransferase [Candidatus Parabeggiatoa sp. HSG14]|uniref:DNA cytosine methyltransferase n=1 Tax=Candidatus Parabeggiatoa sp. HSG14 TaxID=3055593 RepID=UPI0025A8C6E7|nr:DNA cytosine methyltransferase [Thiotrichales bacterium HSG14]